MLSQKYISSTLRIFLSSFQFTANERFHLIYQKGAEADIKLSSSCFECIYHIEVSRLLKKWGRVGKRGLLTNKDVSYKQTPQKQVFQVNTGIIIILKRYVCQKVLLKLKVFVTFLLPDFPEFYVAMISLVVFSPSTPPKVKLAMASLYLFTFTTKGHLLKS